MESHTSMPRVCVVVPNKNGLAHLSYSMPSLFATNYPNFQVVIVDDRSSDASMGFIKEKFPQVNILNNASKRGFAATVNIGVRYAIKQRSDLITISNNDIKVPAWLVERAVALFLADKNIGIVGFREVTGALDGYSFPASPEKVEWTVTKNITGCFFMVRTAIFSTIGFLDEDYFMYGEDNDFFFRVSNAGFTTISADIPVWHYGEGTSGNNPLLSTWLGYRNAMRYSIKNLGPLGVLRMFASLVYHGCLPHLDKRSDDPYLRRIRRFNPLFNWLLVGASCAWNLFYLPKTLLKRFLSPGH